MIIASESTKTQTSLASKLVDTEFSVIKLLTLAAVTNCLILFNRPTVIMLTNSVENSELLESGNPCCEGGFKNQLYPL